MVKQIAQSTQLVSIVVPVFNEVVNVKIFYDNLIDFSTNLSDTQIELIFIDDGSTDSTFKEVQSIAKKDSRVKAVSFTKNQGVNVAYDAGLNFFSGNCMVFIDVDNQYPISLIDDFLKKWREGYKIVFAKRKGYQSKFIYKFFSYLFVSFINIFSDIKLDRDTSYVSIIDREVANLLKKMDERAKYFPGLIRWTGFEVGYVDCKINERITGVSKIGFKKKCSEALNAITNFSSMPLRVWAVFGFIISLLSLFYGIYVLAYAAINGIEVPGYLSILLSVIFMGGLQLISLGVLSEYITKVYNESKKRPTYIVKQSIGFSDQP